ncbi:MAG: hypothetical protein KKE93_00645 [Nanoarchaeota archaeon]|nr:hypothetical protein [Nanoarchaeota archaeon]
MKLDEKKQLLGKINIDIMIGICLGILGNGLYSWLAKEFKPLTVIGTFTFILLVLIYKKESQSSFHNRIELSTAKKVEKYDILKIREEFMNKIETNWKRDQKDIQFHEDKIIQFMIDDIAVFKIIFENYCIILEYYLGSETEYILDIFTKIIKNYKKRSNGKLVYKNSLKALDKPIIVSGRVLY